MARREPTADDSSSSKQRSAAQHNSDEPGLVRFPNCDGVVVSPVFIFFASTTFPFGPKAKRVWVPFL